MQTLIQKIDKKLESGDKFLTPEEAAKYLPWAVYKIRDMIKDGVFGMKNDGKTNGVRYYVRLSEIREYLLR